MSNLSRLLTATCLLCCAFSANSFAAKSVLSLSHLHDNVYAIFGPLGDRTPDNLGNNANFGFVITEAGIVLIDSGASFAGAKAIHALIQTVSKKPVTTVINTGGQDHRWLGNGYFQKLGAKIIASNDAVKDQQSRSTSQLENLTRAIQHQNLAGTKPVFADTRFDTEYTFKSGNTQFQIRHVAGAHTPGDSFVWLPDTRTVFTGDIVYTQRMLGVIPVSNSRTWLSAFDAIANLKPDLLIPGHGKTTDLQSAVNDTYHYLQFLRAQVRAFMKAGNSLQNISKLDQETFSYLQNYDALKGRNAQKVFEELEWE